MARSKVSTTICDRDKMILPVILCTDPSSPLANFGSRKENNFLDDLIQDYLADRPGYANNSAAVTGGLSVGDYYYNTSTYVLTRVHA